MRKVRLADHGTRASSVQAVLSSLLQPWKAQGQWDYIFIKNIVKYFLFMRTPHVMVSLGHPKQGPAGLPQLGRHLQHRVLKDRNEDMCAS